MDETVQTLNFGEAVGISPSELWVAAGGQASIGLANNTGTIKMFNATHPTPTWPVPTPPGDHRLYPVGNYSTSDYIGSSAEFLDEETLVVGSTRGSLEFVKIQNGDWV